MSYNCPTQSRSRSIQRFDGGVTASLAIRLGASKSMGVMGKRERERERHPYIDFGFRNPYNKTFIESALPIFSKCYQSISNAPTLRSKYRRGRAGAKRARDMDGTN